MKPFKSFLTPQKGTPIRNRCKKLFTKFSRIDLALNLILQLSILVLISVGIISQLPTSDPKINYIFISVTLTISTLLVICFWRSQHPSEYLLLAIGIFQITCSIEIQQITSQNLAYYNIVLQIILILTLFAIPTKHLFVEPAAFLYSYAYYMGRNYSAFRIESILFLLLALLFILNKSMMKALPSIPLIDTNSTDRSLETELVKILEDLPIGLALVGNSPSMFSNEKFQDIFPILDSASFKEHCSQLRVLSFQEKPKAFAKSVPISIRIEDQDENENLQQIKEASLEGIQDDLFKSNSNMLQLNELPDSGRPRTVNELINPQLDIPNFHSANWIASNTDVGKPIKAVVKHRSQPQNPKKIFGGEVSRNLSSLYDLLFKKTSENAKSETLCYQDCVVNHLNDQDNSRAVLDLSIIPLCLSAAQNAADSYLIAAFDGTYKLELKRLREVDALKNTLLGYISHEVNTSLNVIFLVIDSLKSMNLELNARKMLHTAITSATLLSFVMKNLEWYSKITTKSVQTQSKSFNIKQLLYKMGSIFKTNVRGKNLKILYDFPQGEFTENVDTDQVMVEQILFNLIGNACKYTQKGFILISLQEEDCSREKCKLLKIGIMDTGIGIKAETIPRLGKFFEKMDFGGKRKDSLSTGLGIGLAVSNVLSKALWPSQREGIMVDSLEDIGSKFSFQFPSRISTKTAAWIEFKPDAGVLNLGLKISENSSKQRMSEIQSILSLKSERYRAIYNEIIEKEPQRTTPRNSPRISHFRSGTQLMDPKGSKPYKKLSYLTNFSDFVPEMRRIDPKINVEHENEFENEFCSEKSASLQNSEDNDDPLGVSDEDQLVEFEIIEEDNAIPFILIVDDNEFNLIALEQILKDSGYKILKARNGVEAISVLQSRKRNCNTLSQFCKLILMDINMPIMDGITCTETLKSKMASGSLFRCPILANSANIVERQKLKFDKEKELFDGYVPKPIEKKKLLEIVSKWINNQGK